LVLLAQSTAIFAPKLAKNNQNIAVLGAIDGSRMSGRTFEGELDVSINHDSSCEDFSGAIGFGVHFTL